MTQQDQERDLSEAREIAPPGFTLDRCRHESITETSLWIFRGAAQVASVSRAGDGWQATRMLRGMPCATRSTATLRDAISYATTQGAR